MSAKLPRVSVIIVNYNGMPFLKNCLSSVLNSDYPKDKLEVIVIDNASTDGSAEYISENFPEVKLVRLNKNLGFSGGANVGALNAGGDILAFLNVDVVVDKDWLWEPIRIMTKSRHIAIVGCNILDISAKEETSVIKIPFLHILGGMIDIQADIHGLKKSYMFTGTIYGAAFLVKKEIFNRIGGFDWSYFMYSDEVDLCLRAWLLGYNVVYCPHSIVYHYGSGIAGKSIDFSKNILHSRVSSPLRAYFGNRNSLANLLKNFETKRLLQAFILSILFSFFLIVAPIRKYEKRLLVLSWISFFRKFKYYLAKRKMVQRERLRSDSWLIHNRLMLDYRKLIRLGIRALFVRHIE